MMAEASTQTELMNILISLSAGRRQPPVCIGLVHCSPF